MTSLQIKKESYRKASKVHPAFVMLGTDIIMALTIILFGIIVCVPNMGTIKKMTFISMGPIEAVSVLKTDMSVYYALHGEWPGDKEALLPFISGKKDWVEEDLVLTANESRNYGNTINNGAIDVTFKKIKGNEKITIRPAIPVEDPLGPVIWIAGKSHQRNGWKIIGKDHSTIEERYVNKALK